MSPRPYLLHESNYRQLLDYRPNVAVLPWGATEAHNYHLPHGTDVIEAAGIAARAAAIAYEKGARPIVLPAIPFGNDSQQLDQVATISISTATALAILSDVAASLKRQNIDRLVIVNGHGGNDFRPLIRDVQLQTGMLIVLANFYQMAPDVLRATFDDPGDHAGDMETSLLLHLAPDWVTLSQAGPGDTRPFEVAGIRQAGVWSPRPWSKSHPDTGCGDPRHATAAKGLAYFEAVATALADLLIGLSAAEKGALPYV